MDWNAWKIRFPEKFAPVEKIFERVHPGARIFIGTACGEPQTLVKALAKYVRMHPTTLFDAELVQVWSLGITPYADEKLKDNFRLNSFFIGENTRFAVNNAAADYTPIFLSNVPGLIYKETMPVDLALIQTSLPDEEGNMSLGISVDIVKSAAEMAALVVAQANSEMPFVHGDGIINIRDLDFVVPCDEPLLQYEDAVPGEIAGRIGNYVARLIQDGATIQVGYGSLPNAVLSQLKDKKNLGLHSELFSDGAAELMKLGVMDNSRKTIDQGLAVASFCMGKKETYDFLHKNTDVMFRTIDYTNDLLVIARQRDMTAINSALEIDLTGQATAESLGGKFYSGVGGQTDFMRGAVLAPGGKAILALPSTSSDGRSSRIVPQAWPGSRSDAASGRRSLRRHGVWHSLPARQKYQGKGHGPDSHCPSEIPSMAGGRSPQDGSDIQGPGLRSGRLSGGSGDQEMHQDRAANIFAAGEDQRRAPAQGVLLCTLR